MIAKSEIELSVKKIGRSWFILAGSSKLARFPSEEKATEALQRKPNFWKFWAESVSVSKENTPHVVV